MSFKPRKWGNKGNSYLLVKKLASKKAERASVTKDTASRK